MEAFTASQDSENRITIGGKRKSSSRRSSILKATKSPLKAGVLEDLDPNSLDDNGRSRSKKSRRSSGRRVSFAEKNDIKEFFVEDWKTAWNKDTEESNHQGPNSASQGEYRKPAESIQGLESLLKGNIQADDNQMCRVEMQEMPEVQYNQLSTTNEDNAVSYGRGILLQTVTDSQAQHAVPLDVTICRGAGIIGANPSDQAEEMDYTKCHSSVLPSAATNMDQTRLFSEDPAIELDVTCTQQEISFRDYPDAQLSSPDNLEQSGKMDSKSFLMSLASKPSSTHTNEVTGPKQFSTSTSVGDAYHKRQPLGEITDMQSSMERKQGGGQNGTQVSNFDDNVELTVCHSYKVLEKSVPKTNRRSIYEPADIDVTSCYGPGLMRSPDKQECRGPDEVNVLRSQSSGVTTNLNIRRSAFKTDWQAQSHPEYTAQLDVTNCYGNGIFPGKGLEVPGVDQTVVLTTNSDNTHSLDLTVCQGQEGNDSDENLELTACHSYEVLDNSIPKTSQKSICEPAELDVTSCYGPGLIKSPEKQITRSYEEHTGQVDTTRCYGKGILPSKRLPVLGTDQTMVFAANTDDTESLDFTVCQPQQGHAAVLPLSVSRSQNYQNDDKLSFHGSDKMDSSAFLKSLCATPHSSATNNNAHDLPGSQDVNALRNQMSGAMTVANANRNNFEKDFQALQLEEQTGQVDTTRCYGKGILPRKRLSVAGADQTMVFAANTDNTESLDFTVCQPQQGLPFSASTSQNYQSDHQSSFHGSGKMDSSLFLKSLNATPHSSATNSDEYDDEMDLTTSVSTEALTGDKMSDQNVLAKSKLSMDSTLMCTNTNEVTMLSPSSSSFPNAYLIKNPFSKTTDVQQPTSHLDENVELTVCHSKPVLDNSMQQKTKRRSVYEPADIDVTSCYGAGLLQSPEKAETSDDVCKSALNLSRSLRAASNANRYSDNVTLNKTQDLPGWNKTQQQQSDFNENLELTSCHSRQLITNNSQKTNRRSIYETADIDVTSCHGVGLVKSSGENLELASRYSQPVLDKSLQKASRRSLYESADVDVTTCHGPGLVTSGENLEFTGPHSQPVLDNSTQRTNRRSLYEPAEIDVTSCHGPGLVTSGENLEFTGPHSQPVLDNSTQRTNRRSLYEPAEIDVTSCHGPGLVTSGETLELTVPHSQPVLDKSSQRANRRSLYEPADVDVTSCHGPGLVNSSGEKLELTGPDIQPVLENSTQRTNRRSLYEPADLDVTSCQGQGLITSGENLELTVLHGQPVLDKSSQKASRRSLYEPADVDVTSCHGPGLVKSSGENLELTVHHGQPVLDKSSQKASRRSLYEPADIDVTSCHGPGLVKSSVENLDLTGTQSQPVFDNSAQRTNRRSFYEPAEIDVTTCHGPGLVNSSGEKLELTDPHSQQVPDSSSQRTNRRSLYEPADLDVTSCQGQGLITSGENLELTGHHSQPVLDNSTQRTNRRSFYEPAEIDVTSCHGAGLVKSFIENSEPSVSHCQHADDNNTQQTNPQSLCEPADIDVPSCQGEQVITGHVSETALNLTNGPETSFHQGNNNATLDKAEELHDAEEILQTSRVAANSNTSLEPTDYSADTDVTSSLGTELNTSIDDQITSDANDRKLSIICEESVNELSKREMSEDANVTEVEEMQNTTQSPITLKQFLDITEIAFITEVNMRRSIAPSNLVEAPKTPKDMIISSLVSKPKAACYEEAIPAIEAEITKMKEKVEQQEMELNASNPRVFMEAQSASKEERLEMQSKVRRLRSVCEKTTKREWKEGKGQLNKRILSKITENHQAIASDVHVVEESLSMVDDCLNLLDKIANDLDEGIQSIRLSLEENEKKLQEQTTMVEQLEAMTEALKKSEQELANLESTRSAMQSEKQELVNRKEQLDVQILENEEAIRLLKNKDPRSESAETKAMSQKLDILESLQEWSLEEWDKERARFTFLKSSLEMTVLFGSEGSDSEDSSPNQEVKSIQLNFTPEEFTGKMRKVHTLVKQAVNQDILTQMCHSKKDLTKVLEHMSEIIFRSDKIGAELFRIGLSHLMSFKENKFVVEFSSLKAFVKFVLYIQLELQSYPDDVTFTVSSMIGHLSQTEIEEALNSVDAGPRYLSRLVDAADQLLNKAKPTSNMPS
ncbi:uncharacterized protein LOC144630668 isoform X2 [Oculina patagonica]